MGGHARTDGEGRERQSKGVDRLGRDGDGDRDGCTPFSPPKLLFAEMTLAAQMEHCLTAAEARRELGRRHLALGVIK